MVASVSLVAKITNVIAALARVKQLFFTAGFFCQQKATITCDAARKHFCVSQRWNLRQRHLQVSQQLQRTVSSFWVIVLHRVAGYLIGHVFLFQALQV